jgi:hypothetical protein
MNRDAAIHLTARLMINNQRMIDLNNFERATRQRAANEGIGYAYDADAARNSFDNSRSRAYEERDMNALKTLLGNSGLMHDVLTGKIDRQTAERILNAPGVTRYILGQ